MLIATDEEIIFQHAQSIGADVVMTSTHHQSGTDRCYEAFTLTNENYDVVINIQGDEPFISPEQHTVCSYNHSKNKMKLQL